MKVLNHQPVPLRPLREVLKGCKSGDVIYVGEFSYNTYFTGDGFGWMLYDGDSRLVCLETGDYYRVRGFGEAAARRLQPGEQLVLE